MPSRAAVSGPGRGTMIEASPPRLRAVVLMRSARFMASPGSTSSRPREWSGPPALDDYLPGRVDPQGGKKCKNPGTLVRDSLLFRKNDDNFTSRVLTRSP